MSPISLRPMQLPEFRCDLADFTASPLGLEYMQRLGGGWARPEGISPADEQEIDNFGLSAQELCDGEVKGLRGAALFHVSETMTDLAVAAAASLPEFQLADFDLPARTGFIFFDKPIALLERHSGPGQHPATQIRACLWQRQDLPDGYGIVWESFYGDWYQWLDDAVSRGYFDQAVLADCIGRDHPLQLETYCGEPLVISGNKPKYSQREHAMAQELESVSRVLRSAWLLLQQPLAQVTEVSPARGTRRRMQRAGREAASVRVIELRRRQHAVADSQSEREWHHQWIVRGHWRNQWYPAHEVHRPIWIAPHIKGPEGAPMLGGEKVYAWKR